MGRSMLRPYKNSGRDDTTQDVRKAFALRSSATNLAPQMV